MKHRLELTAVMETEVADAASLLSVADAEVRMKAEEVPFARIRRLTELHDDPQVQHNGLFRDLEHPVAGPLRDARPAARFSATPAEPGGAAPTAGQHTREILAEVGLAERIDALYRAGVGS